MHQKRRCDWRCWLDFILNRSILWTCRKSRLTILKYEINDINEAMTQSWKSFSDKQNLFRVVLFKVALLPHVSTKSSSLYVLLKSVNPCDKSSKIQTWVNEPLRTTCLGFVPLPRSHPSLCSGSILPAFPSFIHAQTLQPASISCSAAVILQQQKHTETDSGKLLENFSCTVCWVGGRNVM